MVTGKGKGMVSDDEGGGDAGGEGDGGEGERHGDGDGGGPHSPCAPNALTLDTRPPSLIHLD